MSRQGPNYHDDPRLEAGEQPDFIPKTEADRRRARLGSDMARTALGLDEENSLESKVDFISDESLRIQKLITNSDLQNPQIKSRLNFMIDAGAQRGAITADEASGLRHYLEHAEGFTDNLGRERDTKELRSKDS